ncbi:MAG: hypothetical protein K2P12_05640, partial [Clostridia bacterium]|nr:hypothetical protein [Clostridia bacterium]
GITLYNGSVGKINECEILNNETINDSAALLIFGYSQAEIYNSTISGNIARDENESNYNTGGAMAICSGAEVTLNETIIENNMAEASFSQSSSVGGIYLNNGKLNLGDCIIRGNNAKGSSTNKVAGGIGVFGSNDIVNIVGTPHIYDNYVVQNSNQRESDLALLHNKKINIQTRLWNMENTARIGIELPNDYPTVESGEKIFTIGYGLHKNSTGNLNKHFFINNSSKSVISQRVDGHVEAGESVNTELSATNKYWKWGNSDNEQTYDPVVRVPYTGNAYIIKNEGGQFAKTSEDTMVNEYSVTEVGSYSFYTTENVANPVFIFTILPVEVDIKWSSNDFIYNGGLQKPTAY